MTEAHHTLRVARSNSFERGSTPRKNASTYLFAALIFVTLPGCGWLGNPTQPADEDTEFIRHVIYRTPKTSVLTVIAPNLELLDEQSIALGLDRFEGFREALRLAGNAIGAEKSESFVDLGEYFHLDTESPNVLFVRPSDDGEGYDIIWVSIPIDSQASRTVATTMIGTQRESPDLPAAVVEGEFGVHGITDEAFVLSTSGDFFRDFSSQGVDGEPHVYLTDACPPIANEALAILVDIESAKEFFRNNGLPVISQYLEGANAEFDDIIVESWNAGSDTEISVRVHHPNATASTPLTLAPMLPPASESFIGWRMSKEGKDALREQWLATLPPSLENDPLYAMAATQLESFLHAIDDEVALAAMGLEAARPQFVALFSLRDSNQAATLLGAFSPLFKEIAREGDTPVYGLPPEMGVPVAYALHDGVLILGPDAGMVAGAVHQITVGNPTALYESTAPPLNPSEPAAFRALLTQRLLADLIIPLVQGGDMDPRSQSLIEFVSRSRALHIHRVQHDQWDTWNLLAIP